MKINKYWFEDIKFLCKKCGACCHSQITGQVIVLYQDDIIRISKFVNLAVTEFMAKYLKRNCYRYIFTDVVIKTNKMVLEFNGKCPFLKNNLCSIYKVKPTQCSLLPFAEPFLSDYKQAKQHFANCNGINDGRIVSLEYIRNNYFRQKESEEKVFYGNFTNESINEYFNKCKINKTYITKMQISTKKYFTLLKTFENKLEGGEWK